MKIVGFLRMDMDSSYTDEDGVSIVHNELKDLIEEKFT